MTSWRLSPSSPRVRPSTASPTRQALPRHRRAMLHVGSVKLDSDLGCVANESLRRAHPVADVLHSAPDESVGFQTGDGRVVGFPRFSWPRVLVYSRGAVRVVHGESPPHDPTQPLRSTRRIGSDYHTALSGLPLPVVRMKTGCATAVARRRSPHLGRGSDAA